MRVVSAAAIPIILFAAALAHVRLPARRRRQPVRRLAGVAIVVGVGGVFLLYWAMNRLVDYLPDRIRGGVRPYVFVGPALVILAVFLVYPVINTIIISFGDRQGEGFVGLDNYEFVFTDESMLRSIRNTAGWIIIVPAVAVSIGLALRHARRPAAPGRAGGEVADLHADGDLVRRRRRHLAAHLRLPPRRVRHQHRPAQRHQVRARA